MKEYQIEVAGYGVFHVRGPNDAQYEGAPTPGHLETAFRIGPVHALQRHLAGDLVLHGNAVHADRTILIMGGKAWGKSSLMAALLARGAKPVADDVLAITWQDARPHVRPGHPYLKMWPDTARLYGRDPDELEPIYPGSEKRILPMPMSPALHVVDEVLILERGQRADKTRLAPTEAVVHVSAHAHHTPRDHGLFGQAQLDACARLAREVPIFRLSVPEGLAHVEAAAKGLIGP